MAKIEVRDVAYQYAGGGGPILENLSLAVEEGEFVCVVGRSGCGKTTLLRLLAGLASPTRGSIHMGGRPVTGPGTDRAVVFQDYPLFPWMSARDNILFGTRQTGKWTRSQARQRAEAFLARVGLAGEGGKYPCQLSGGMRQRVALARALAMDTEVLLMDEPFGALDPKTRQELQGFLEELWLDARGRKTLVFITHDVDEALRLADRVVFLSDKRISADLPIHLPRPRSGLEDWAVRRDSARNALVRLFGKEDAVPCRDGNAGCSFPTPP